MKAKNRIAFSFLIIINILYGQGTLVRDSFYSVSLDTNRRVNIYLPPGYDSLNIAQRFPVIYFLHGINADHNSYFTETILDDFFTDPKQSLPPLILVMPDGSTEPYGGSFYTNSELYGLFEDYIVYDLLQYIDSQYNTHPFREKRSIMGHSMGGYGSMKLALKHPEIYCGVASLSGSGDFDVIVDKFIMNVLAENGGEGPYSPDAGFYTLAMFTLSGAFSPNLGNPPYYVDFCIDDSGNLIDSVYSKWQYHDLPNLARQYSLDSDLAIYFDCGKGDELDFYPANTAFADTLDSLGIPYEFHSFEGGHSDRFYSRFPFALEFLTSIMDKPVTVSNEISHLPQNFGLHQNYPNPFNPVTTIHYDLPEQSNVLITVYDILGREIRKLVNTTQDAGYKSIIWDGTDEFGRSVGTGIYLYQIRAGDFTQTRKMLLLQ